MKYGLKENGMWLLFEKSFRDNLISVLGFDKNEAGEITVKSKRKYREIVDKLPEFEKVDRFKVNILSCAMFAAFILNMKERPSVEKLTEYYEKAMMTETMKWFCRVAGKNKFTDNDIEGMKKTARCASACCAIRA